MEADYHAFYTRKKAWITRPPQDAYGASFPSARLLGIGLTEVRKRLWLIHVDPLSLLLRKPPSHIRLVSE